MKIFEVIMLLCFGAAWPFSVYKSWKARTAKGKSLIFLLALVVGYICGIIYNCTQGDGPDYVLYFYALNLLLVSVDTGLYFRNTRIDNNHQD